MNEENNYEARMDNLFENGAIWPHRTLRTLFDPYSEEWKNTDLNEKVQILRSITASEESFLSLIYQFKDRYEENGRIDISSSVEVALATILEYQLKRHHTD